MKYDISPRIDLLLESGGGGAGRHVLDLYTGLRRRGWDARLILSTVRMDPMFSAEVAEVPPEHLTLLKLRRSPHFTDVSAVQSLRKNLTQNSGPYILHAHSTKAGMIGWALGNTRVKRILTPHAYRGMDPVLSGLRRTVVRRAERAFTLRFDAVIAVSEAERLYAISLGVDEKKIYTIGNGVDASKLIGCVRARSLMRNPDHMAIGFIGRLVHQKNPLLFIQVFAQLLTRGLPVRACIIGDGPLRPHLQEFASQLGIAECIDWRGAVSAVEEMKQIDVLVHTSHYESSPYSLLEAVAANIPVVAVPNAGSCSIFEEHLPEALVSSMDFLQLADSVETVLFNSALRHHYTTKYDNILSNHSIDKMVDRTIGIYESVLTSRSKATRVPARSQILKDESAKKARLA